MDQPSLRVLSYNIHKGFSTTKSRFVLENIREAVRLVQADLVFLQEIVGHRDDRELKTSTSVTTDQLEFLADSIWSHYAYGKNAIYESGHHGNAILSHYPFAEVNNVDISTNPLEMRGMLCGSAEVPATQTKIHLVCVHLGLTESGRKQQVHRLIHHLQSIPRQEPVILAGDFNDWRERATQLLEKEAGMVEIFQEQQGAHAKSFPSFLPLLPLDRIYYRNLTPVNSQCLTGPPWNRLSDHTALFAEFRLRPNDDPSPFAPVRS